MFPGFSSIPQLSQYGLPSRQHRRNAARLTEAGNSWRSCPRRLVTIAASTRDMDSVGADMVSDLRRSIRRRAVVRYDPARMAGAHQRISGCGFDHAESDNRDSCPDAGSWAVIAIPLS